MIHCQDSAFRDFHLELRKRNVLQIFPLNSYNHSRHRLFQADKKKYYVIFKREYYNSFEHEFKELFNKYPELQGKGESINQESLNLALNREVEAIVFIHPEGMFRIYPALIKSFCEKNNLVRTQDKYNTYNETFDEYYCKD